MTVDELLLSISEGLKKPLTKNEILSNEINVSHLKRIDKIFKDKGLIQKTCVLTLNSAEVSKRCIVKFSSE